MTHHRTAEALRQLGDAARTAALADAALLAQFAAARDQTAFAELVRRHGPLVLGVCRRIAGHRQDAEDAFQATFLILAAKAGAVADPGRLGNWLYGVAYRVARKARRAAVRRRAREVQVAAFPDPLAPPAEPAPELGPVLDAALAGLPEVYRSAVLLCDLQQKSRAEAAALLGVPEGTLSSRLAAGRKRLADRLARRGVAISAVTLGAILTERGTAAVPGGLAAKTAEAVADWSAGGILAANVRSLMSDGGPAMWKATGVIAAAVAAVGLAVGGAAAWPGANPGEPAKPAAKAEPQAKAADGGDKPAKSAKPRLLKTVGLDGPAAAPTWSPDGSLLAVSGRTQVVIYDGRTLEGVDTIPIAEAGTPVGFTREKPALVTYLNGPRRINSVTQLRSWELPKKNETGAWVALGPHLVKGVDLDPADGTPFAVSSDGKTVLTVAYERKQMNVDERPIVVATRFLRLEASTGEAIKEIAKVDGRAIPGFAASPDGSRLVLLTMTGKAQLVAECLDVETGRRAWVRTVADGETADNARTSNSTLAISPDGMRLSLTVPVGVVVLGRPTQNPGQNLGDGRSYFDPKSGRQMRDVHRVFLLDMADGGVFHPPEGAADESWSGLGFSHDGKLFVGRSGSGRSDAQLRIWDVRSGKALKTWDGFADAVFAPDRPTLAVLENYAETAPNAPANGFGQAVNKAALGLWDLSALVK